MNINQHDFNKMEERAMIDKLAAAAGLSALELQGFYDTVREQGYAYPDNMEWLLGRTMPVEITFRAMQLPLPTGGEAVPFPIIARVFKGMYVAKLNAEIGFENQMPGPDFSEEGPVRWFVISYIVNAQGKIGFSELACKTAGGQYPRKAAILADVSRQENVHPSSVGVLNVRELTEEDMKSYLGL